MHDDLADSIASSVLNKYADLHPRYKVRHIDGQRKEWTILAGVVLRREHDKSHEQDLDGSGAESIVECVSLATGMKCLPRHKVEQASGNVLHDWHAEILCLRGLNRWILDECQRILDGEDSRWVMLQAAAPVQLGGPDRTTAEHNACPFALRPHTQIHMYISAAPCGDASMELIMATQPDATPWTAPVPSASPDDMLGRAHFDQLGVVRRKPARPDAPVTLSKSCSDKLAAKQCTSLLSSVVARLFCPSTAYLSTLVVPKDEFVESAMSRAFGPSGRMSPMNNGDTSVLEYAFQPFEVLRTRLHFEHSKSSGAVPSNIAFLLSGTRRESLINGVLQGRKQTDPRGASCVARRRMAEEVLRITKQLQVSGPGRVDMPLSYAMLKAGNNDQRQLIKQDLRSLALKGWKSNDSDDAWIVHSTQLQAERSTAFGSTRV